MSTGSKEFFREFIATWIGKFFFDKNLNWVTAGGAALWQSLEIASCAFAMTERNAQPEL